MTELNPASLLNTYTDSPLLEDIFTALETLRRPKITRSDDRPTSHHSNRILNMDKLSKVKRDEIDAILRQAQEVLNSGDKQYSAKLAEQAWRLLPDPKFEWDVSKSFAHAVAELYRDSGYFAAALDIMNDLFSSGTVNHTKTLHTSF